MAAAGQRQRRHHAGERGEAVEEIVLGAEHDRRPHDRGLGQRGKNPLLAFRLRLRIVRRRVRVGADRRDVNELRAGGLGGERHRLGALGLHRVETLPAALEQDADQVDDDVGVAHRRRNRLRVAQIGLHRVDLPDPAHRPQKAGELRPAHRDADAVLPLRQRPHHVAAEEA